MKMNDKLLLTVAEAARLCGFSKSFLYAALSQGKLPCVRLGRTARIPRAWLERWIADQVSVWEEARRDG